MIDFRLGRYALGLGVAVAMLAGCGGHASNGVVPVDGVPNSLANHKSFYYTGGAQDFTVPAGVTHITVVARGAHGAGSATQAYGGRVHAIIRVTPGEELVIYVGGDASGATGGFNGGGSGGVGKSIYSGFGGGGASDVRQGGDTLRDRILATGGGGGQGNEYYQSQTPYGGNGGGRIGESGGGFVTSGASGFGGAGGTQDDGGSGGARGGSGGRESGGPGSQGALGKGGNGGVGGRNHPYQDGFGGGGGGGFYGGGGGGGGSAGIGSIPGFPGGGGGGGSSYVEPSATDVHMRQGWKNPAPNGLVVLSW